MFEVLAWIAAITLFTVAGSYYARRFARPDALIALYVTFILLSQIMASKIAVFDLGFAQLVAPSAVLVYSVTYLMTDIVNERFGRKAVHWMIFICFVTQVAMVFFLWLATIVTPAPFWGGQEAWESIIGMVPRIVVASWIAFLVSENFDAIIYAWFRKITKGRHLWMRNAFSSLPALTLDTFLFISIAFWGLAPLDELIPGQMGVKWLVGLVNIPFMYLNKWIMRAPDLLDEEKGKNKKFPLKRRKG